MKLEPFFSRRFLKNPHLQSIVYYVLFRAFWVVGVNPLRKFKSIGRFISTQDGTRDRLFLELNLTGQRTDPAVILVHGLEGSSRSPHLVHLTKKLISENFQVIRMNLRSCGYGVYTASRFYNARFTIDLETVARYVHDNIADDISIVGFSLGGSLVLKLLGEKPSERDQQLRLLNSKKGSSREKIPISSFVVVSTPLDLIECTQEMHKGINGIYRRYFLLKEHRRAQHPNYKIDRGQLRELRKGKDQFYRFNNLIIVPQAGFKNYREYCEFCSAKNYIENIDVMGYMLSSKDDPIIPAETLAELQHKIPKNIRLHITEQGGHVGWLAPRKEPHPDGRWIDYCILSYLKEWRSSRFD